jgi:hypothetical protein
MSDDPQNELKPVIRQLPQEMNFFLKRAMPKFTVKNFADAFIILWQTPPDQSPGWLPMGTRSSDQSSNSIDS